MRQWLQKFGCGLRDAAVTPEMALWPPKCGIGHRGAAVAAGMRQLAVTDIILSAHYAFCTVTSDWSQGLLTDARRSEFGRTLSPGAKGAERPSRLSIANAQHTRRLRRKH